MNSYKQIPTVGYLNDRKQREEKITNSNKEIKIEMGEEYFIQLYPQKEVVLGELILEDSQKYLFKCSDGDNIIVRRDHATIEDKAITHIPIYSIPITKTKIGNY